MKLLDSFVLESFPPEKRLIEESPEGVRLLSHHRTLFVSVGCGGQITCKVGVLCPPFESTHLIRGMGAIESTLLGGGGAARLLKQKTNVLKIRRL